MNNMIPKNSEGYRIWDKWQIFPEEQLTRPIPTIHNASVGRLRKINSFAQDYINFLANGETQAPWEVVSEIERLSGTNNGYIIKNPQNTAFALVKKGRRPIEEGLRILASHTDSPCLQTKGNPVRLVWDPDKQQLSTGVLLHCFPYGGPQHHLYRGRSLKLKGYLIDDGKRKEIQMDVFNPEIAQHTDDRRINNEGMAEAFKEEEMRVSTGYSNLKKLLEKLGLGGERELEKARILVFPRVTPTLAGEGFLRAYGHDDKTGIYTSFRALTDSSPEYTTLFMGFDREEVGSDGNGGANSKFFDRVINEVLVREGFAKNLESLTEAAKLKLFEKSLLVNTDCDIGATHLEDAEHRVDINSICKLGHGAFFALTDGICDGDQTTPELSDRVMSIFKKRDIEFQPIGAFLANDFNWGFASMNTFFDRRGIDTVNVGVPVACTHCPEEEISIGDLYAAYEAQKALLCE
jgi:aspartyl aminopeptidase